MPTKPNIGDYVLATKWHDGNPQDHWCIGFLSEVMDDYNPPRYGVIDNEGNPFRANGFRRIAKISLRRGAYILKNKHNVQSYDKSLWWWLRQKIDSQY